MLYLTYHCYILKLSLTAKKICYEYDPKNKGQIYCQYVLLVRKSRFITNTYKCGLNLQQNYLYCIIVSNDVLCREKTNLYILFEQS